VKIFRPTRTTNHVYGASAHQQSSGRIILTKGRIARRIVSPRGVEWIRPTFTPIWYMLSWAHASHLPTASRSVQPFSQGSRTWQTDRHTDRPRYSA